jgi:hypothetical protein
VIRHLFPSSNYWIKQAVMLYWLPLKTQFNVERLRLPRGQTEQNSLLFLSPEDGNRIRFRNVVVQKPETMYNVQSIALKIDET